MLWQWQSQRFNKASYLETALVITNLIGAKVTDSIAKTLVKTDLTKMVGNQTKDDSIQVDLNIQIAKNVAEGCLEDGWITQESLTICCRDSCFDRCCCFQTSIRAPELE